MSRIRVFVPHSLDGLTAIAGVGQAGDAAATLLQSGAEAHAVTDALRAEFPEADDEELEYLAMTAAAQHSVMLVRSEGPYGRVVLAVDVDAVEPAHSEDPTAALISSEVRLRDLASVHLDSEDAAPDVRAARAAVVDGAQDADERLTRCLDHELGWYAVTELDEVVRRSAADH